MRDADIATEAMLHNVAHDPNFLLPEAYLGLVVRILKNQLLILRHMAVR